MDALRRIVQALRQSARDAEKTTGMSGAQLFVLQTLAPAGKATIGELARRTRTDQSSVSVVVTRLEERGLVSRRAAPTDARRVEVTLTSRGRKLAATAEPPAQARLVATLEELPEAKLALLRSGLEDLVAGMGQEREPAQLFFEEPAATKVKS
jgi:DNA-binding MarR family transcriptional regulator